MNRASTILLAMMAAAAPVAAQDAAPPPPAAVDPEPAVTPAAGSAAGDASSIVLAGKAPASVPMRAADEDDTGRAVSSKVAAALNLGMPKYAPPTPTDRKSTRLNSSHLGIPYAVFCLK